MAFKLLCQKAFTIYSRDECFIDLLSTDQKLAMQCLENAVRHDYWKYGEHKQSIMISYLKNKFSLLNTK